jgi:Circularly permutated YpsA SLOG family
VSSGDTLRQIRGFVVASLRLPRNVGVSLKESLSASYLQRTEWNVRDSDATVLFSLAPELTGGSKKTVEFAEKHHKPWIHFATGEQDIAQRLKDWLAQNSVEVLNVAGPRASKEPGIASFVILTLDAVFGS